MTRDECREKLQDEFGEAFCISYFDRSGFAADIITPWSFVAYDRFIERASRFLKREGIALGKPLPVHMEPGAKPVVFSKHDLERSRYD